MSQSDAINQLKDMGFQESDIQLAIKQTNSSDLVVLLEWIQNYQDNPQMQLDIQAQQEQSQNQIPDQSQFQNLQTISHLVNQENVALLISLGHSKNVSEKSLLLTGNQSVEEAEKWIKEHKNDNDFEEELRIEKQDAQSNLTDEEARERAKKLQQQIREKKKREEEEYEREKEINRIKFGKQALEQKRILDEAKIKREADLQKRQKEQDERDRQKVLEQLRKDKEERHGKKYAAQDSNIQKPQQVQQTPIQLFELSLKQIWIAYPSHLYDDLAIQSMSLITKIIQNVVQNQNEEKYRQISLTSKAFTEKIEKVLGAENALLMVGFINNGTHLQLQNPDWNLLSQALKIAQDSLELATKGQLK